MTNIDHAADILAETGAYCGQCCFGECGEPDCPRDADWRACPDCAAAVNGYARALAAAGLLMPEPQIIRTRDELAALDPDTLLRGRYEGDDWHQEVRDLQYLNGTWRPWIENVLPCVVIATGEQVRAARQALREAADAVD